MATSVRADELAVVLTGRAVISLWLDVVVVPYRQDEVRLMSEKFSAI
jgi:hypothetical protein